MRMHITISLLTANILFSLVPLVSSFAISSNAKTKPIHDYLLIQENNEEYYTDTNNDLPFAHQTALADGVFIQASEGRGMGVFAALPIPKGAWFGEYAGEILTKEQVERRYWEDGEMNKDDERWIQSRELRNQTMTGEYLFDVGNDFYIDGEDLEKSSWGRYLNHASLEEDEKNGTNFCNADVEEIPENWEGDVFIPPRLFFVALRDIEVGEEICFNYGDYYWEGYEDMIV